MKTVSNTLVFVDTNILYYANDPNETFGKQAIARTQELVTAGNELIISTQVIREYTHATLRNALYLKLDSKTSIAAVLQNITIFQRDFTVLYDSPEIVKNWLALLPSLTTHKDIFDFNIAATLQTHGIAHILTHNSSDFEKFKDWLTILPLFP